MLWVFCDDIRCQCYIIPLGCLFICFFNHRLCMTRYTEIPTITDVEGEEVIYHCEHEANISVDKSNLCCRMYEKKKKRD